MKKIITAIGNPILNQKLRNKENIEVIGNDIQYQEGIFEILEKENNVHFLILSELLQGGISVEKLIEKIKLINKNIKIIMILENKKEEIEDILIRKGVFKVLYHNQIEIKDMINLIQEEPNNENEELKKEINHLKKLVLEKSKNETLKINMLQDEIKRNQNLKMRQLPKNKWIEKTIEIYQKRIKKENRHKEIISISGPSGVGKSIISINLAKSMIYKKSKILIIDFDVLNNSLHTILGVKKYPLNISENLNINETNIKKYIIKINRKIDLISATNLLFSTREKINLVKIQNIIIKLKEIYDTIIIDTSSECFFDFTKVMIGLSNKNIFVTECNLVEIKKAKELLNIYVNTWKLKKEKFNILLNKYDKNCIDIQILKEIFCEFNIIGVLKYNAAYNKLINQNIKTGFYNKKIRNEYLKINYKLI